MLKDLKDLALLQLREENAALQREIDDSVSRELAVSVLKSAEAELARSESGLRAVIDEIAKSRACIQALLTNLNPPT